MPASGVLEIAAEPVDIQTLVSVPRPRPRTDLAQHCPQTFHTTGTRVSGKYEQ